MIDSKKSILIIDDDPSILRVFQRVLSKKGYSVDTAETWEKARTKLKAGFYDISLIDLRFPEKDGTDLFPLMNEVAPKMVKIMITGMPNVKDSFKSQEGGADAFLRKPVDPEMLLDLIKMKLKEKELIYI